jgi:hypothetical protein
MAITSDLFQFFILNVELLCDSTVLDRFWNVFLLVLGTQKKGKKSLWKMLYHDDDDVGDSCGSLPLSLSTFSINNIFMLLGFGEQQVRGELSRCNDFLFRAPTRFES